MTTSRPEGNTGLDPRTDALLARALGLAELPLEGIEEQARELAAIAAGDRAVVERARRAAMRIVDEQPNHVNKQVLSLLRRALEVGEWRWEN